METGFLTSQPQTTSGPTQTTTMYIVTTAELRSDTKTYMFSLE